MRYVVQGLRQAMSMPWLLLLLWATNVLAALPFALIIEGSLDHSFSGSHVAERMAEGFDNDWFAELEGEPSGLEETFSPVISGKGAVLEVLEVWGSGELFFLNPEIVSLGVAYGILWAFLMGGLLGRLVSGEPGHFAQSAGRYFWRFLGLGLLSAGLYGAVFWCTRWLFGRLEDWATDQTRELPVFWGVLSIALLGWAFLHTIRLIFDAARIVVVVDDQGNVLRALKAGLSCILRRPGSFLGVYLAFGALTLGGMSTYAYLAPTVGPSAWLGVAIAFLFGQAYRVFRLGIRAGWLAAGVQLYRDTRS